MCRFLARTHLTLIHSRPHLYPWERRGTPFPILLLSAAVHCLSRASPRGSIAVAAGRSFFRPAAARKMTRTPTRCISTSYFRRGGDCHRPRRGRVPRSGHRKWRLIWSRRVWWRTTGETSSWPMSLVPKAQSRGVFGDEGDAEEGVGARCRRRC